MSLVVHSHLQARDFKRWRRRAAAVGCLLLAPCEGQQYTSLSDVVRRGSGRLNLTRGIEYDAAIEAQLER